MPIPSVPIPDNPAFFDKLIVQMQQQLKDGLPWLNYSFGRAQKVNHLENSDSKFYPEVHIGNGEYVRVMPDDQLGNFSFFKANYPQSPIWGNRSFQNVDGDFSLIFWFNLNSIFQGAKDRESEAVKAEIYHLLTRDLRLVGGRLNSINAIFEEADDVYNEFDYSEIKEQFHMQPYAGLRFDLSLQIWANCL